MYKPKIRINPSEEVVGDDFVDMVYPLILDYKLSETIKSGIIENMEPVERYPHHFDRTTNSLAQYLSIEPNRIWPTIGANGALDLVCRNFLSGLSVVVPTPVFWQIEEAIRRNHGTAVHVDILGNQFRDNLLNAFSKNDAVFLCSPNNPLGNSFDPEMMDDLVRVSLGRKLIIVDESYADIAASTFANHLMPDNVIVVRGFKVLLAPGARIGYIVAHPDLINQLYDRVPPFEIDVYAESVVYTILQNFDEIRLIFEQVKKDRNYFEASLKAFGEVYISDAPFLAFKYPGNLNLGAALFKHKILTMYSKKGVLYGMPENVIRMTVRRPEIVRHVTDIIQKLL